MQLRFRARNVTVTTSRRGAIERRVRLALGRHAAGIEQARITLARDGDEDARWRCRIHLRLHRGDSLAFEENAEDPMVAATGAARRLEQRLERRRAAQLHPPIGRGVRRGAPPAPTPGRRSS